MIAARVRSSVIASALTPDEQILHALNRLAFGPRPGDVQKVRAMGLDQWIEQQLHPERIDAVASVARQFPENAVQQHDHAVKNLGLRGAAVGASVAR